MPHRIVNTEALLRYGPKKWYVLRSMLRYRFTLGLGSDNRSGISYSMPALFNYSMLHRIVNTKALLRSGPKQGLCFGPCFGLCFLLGLGFTLGLSVFWLLFLVRFGPCFALGLKLMTNGCIAMAL